MAIPKINFRYSWIYDKNMEHWTAPSRIRYHYKYPSEKSVERKIVSYRKAWLPYGTKILSEMSKSYGLKWKEDILDCYVVGSTIPFSDPLTLPSYFSNERLVDTLTHELIHQIQIQNRDKTHPLFKWLDKRYAKESQNARIHIPVHAVHAQICLDLFDETRLRRIIKSVQKSDYIRAWEIVQNEGHEKLIEEFRKRIK
jgi:hypothetical protein